MKFCMQFLNLVNFNKAFKKIIELSRLFEKEVRAEILQSIINQIRILQESERQKVKAIEGVLTFFGIFAEFMFVER